MNEFYKEIESLSNQPGVKKNAVENFLSSVDICESVEAAKKNMVYDAKMYKWNYETVVAIVKGITKAQELGILV